MSKETKTCGCTTPGDTKGFNTAIKITLCPLYDHTGKRNHIDLSKDIDEQLDKISVAEMDSTKRWYPLPPLESMSNDESKQNQDPIIRSGIRIINWKC